MYYPPAVDGNCHDCHRKPTKDAGETGDRAAVIVQDFCVSRCISEDLVLNGLRSSKQGSDYALASFILSGYIRSVDRRKNASRTIAGFSNRSDAESWQVNSCSMKLFPNKSV